LNAEQYLKSHWIRNKVWTHLEWEKHQRRLEQCADFLGSGKRFIDIGCACGHSTAIMKKFHPGEWHGADFADCAIDIAKDQFPEIEFHAVAGVEALCHLGTFDGVVCSEVIEHVHEDRRFIENVMAVCRGSAVFTTPTRKVSDPGHLRVYRIDSLRELFKDFEFEIHQIEPFFYVIVRERER